MRKCNVFLVSFLLVLFSEKIVFNVMFVSCGFFFFRHIKDILIVTAVCQLASCFSLYFWLLWLVVSFQHFSLVFLLKVAIKPIKHKCI